MIVPVAPTYEQQTGQCARCNPPAGMGFTLPAIPLPAPFNDWRILAVIALVIVLLFSGIFAGKTEKRRKARIERLKERLRHGEEQARIAKETR